MRPGKWYQKSTSSVGGISRSANSNFMPCQEVEKWQWQIVYM